MIPYHQKNDHRRGFAFVRHLVMMEYLIDNIVTVNGCVVTLGTFTKYLYRMLMNHHLT